MRAAKPRHGSSRSRAQLWRALFWMALAGSYILSVLPGETVAPLFSWSDKLNHAGAFLVLALLMRLGWRIGYWQTLAWLSAYGGLIEISQLFAIHRSAEWGDVGADTLGVFFGLKLYKYVRKLC